MRRYLTIVALTIALVVAGLLAVVFTASASTTTTDVSTASPLDSVSAVLQAAAAADKNITSGAGQFSITITPQLAANASGPLAIIGKNPIVLSGTVAVDAQTPAAEVTLNVTSPAILSGQAASFLWLGSTGWLEYGGTWYDLPPQLLTKLQQAEARHEQQAKPPISAAELGLDPQSWLSGLSLETDGSAYHISTGFDVSKMVSDALTALESSQLQTMLSAHLSATRMAQIESALATAKSEDLPALAAQVVVGPKADLWIDSSSNQPTQVDFSVKIVPPASANSPLSSVEVAFSGTVDSLGGPVNIESAPPSPQPWSALQTQIQALQQTLAGLN